MYRTSFLPLSPSLFLFSSLSLHSPSYSGAGVSPEEERWGLMCFYLIWFPCAGRAPVVVFTEAEHSLDGGVSDVVLGAGWDGSLLSAEKTQLVHVERDSISTAIEMLRLPIKLHVKFAFLQFSQVISYFSYEWKSPQLDMKSHVIPHFQI